jgi:adenine-specific DNA methylase
MRSFRSTNFSSTLVATDPPYFDQIDYADLSDYFYFSIFVDASLENLHLIFAAIWRKNCPE